MSADCILNNWRVDVYTFAPKYGLLYNWYAVADVRNICSEGWHIPSFDEYTTFYNFVNGSSLPISDTNTDYWYNPFNHLVTNLYKFNARGNGFRWTYDGSFFSLTSSFICWLLTEATNGACHMTINLSLTDGNKLNPPPSNPSYSSKNSGEGVRLLKDSTILSHGQTGIYIGNDGKVYRTICIGTQEWLADNLCETRYRNGDHIPEVTDNAAWVALTTGAMCAYIMIGIMFN